MKRFALPLLAIACGRPIGDPDNVAPIANAGADRTVQVGEQLVFDARASTDEDGTIVSVKWNFGDGTTSVNELVEHIYQSPGLYVVSLTVTDDDGASSRDEAFVNVAAPGLVARVIVTPDTGARALSAVTFDASTSSGPAPIVSATWSFGDGETGSGLTIDHSYREAGTFHVVLTVTDSSGASDSAEIDVTVQPPDVNGIWSIASTPSSYACGAYAAQFPDRALHLALDVDGSATATGEEGRVYDGSFDDGVLTLAGEHILATGGGCGDAPVSTTIRATFESDARFTATATAYYDLSVGCQCSAAFTLMGTR